MNRVLPTVIIPYPGPANDRNTRDIFVYLRPETNGVLVESTLLQVIEGSARYSAEVELIYLANIPGDFIINERIVENRYRYKMPFARRGGEAFTGAMIDRFEAYFHDRFIADRVVGAFEALDILGIGEEDLFNLRVPGDSVLNMNGQTVKKIGDLYIVNYDIPALIHKNSNQTDIAVMLFRSEQTKDEFHAMIEQMAKSLQEVGILRDISRIGRAFHYTKGPFEQLLDARGHLYSPDGTRVPLEDLQFCSFLRGKGILCSEVDKILDNPIMVFRGRNGEIREECLYAYSQDASYEEAYQLLLSSISQYLTNIQ